MIKVALISLIGVGGLGLNAETITPKSVELNAGAIVISADGDGISTDVGDVSDFALRIKTNNDRVIAIRF
ncbi:hypothetical protein [Hellea balneolensis]|uniref:hypothetical protein n=1 Tax=Hellea balneolensis TaxID=287478 RepID=UPI00041CD660|nr:hypothetical protein [Hellea balneolensis]